MHHASGDHRHPRGLAWIALGLALLGAAAMLYYHQRLFLPLAHEAMIEKGVGAGYSWGNDFFPVWLTAREARRGRDPYSPQMTRQIQLGLFGRPLDRPGDPHDLRIFAHPAYTLLLIWPLAAMPFEAARVLLSILLLAMLIATVLLWVHALSWPVHRRWVLVALVLTLSSYPSLEALYAEQVGIVVAFLLALAIILLQRGRLLLAGVLLALASIKPQITALVSVYLLLFWTFSALTKRLRFLLGFFTTLLLLIAATLLIWPLWIQEWLGVLKQYHDYSEPSLLAGLLTSLPGSHLAGPATNLLTAAAIVSGLTMAWIFRFAAPQSFPFVLTVSVLLALTTIALLPGQAVYDHGILLPGILISIRYRREIRASGRIAQMLLALGALVLFWPWPAAVVVVALHGLGPTLVSKTLLALPIRTAASLPIAVLGLLAYLLQSDSSRHTSATIS